MTYHVTHYTGSMEADFPVERFGDLYDELCSADSEHSDVSVTHESEWSLAVYKSGFVVLENLEDGDPLHAGPLDRETVLELMRAVAEGRIADAQAHSWTDGYPSR